MKKILSVIILLGLSSVQCDSAWGQNAAFEIHRHVTLFKRQNPYVEIPGFYADVDLGEINVGKSGIVNLELVNPFEESIDFEGLQVGCACVDIVNGESNKSLLAGKSMKLKFKLSTPPTAEDSTVQLAINFKAPPNKDSKPLENLYVISLQIKYRLAGMIAFQGRSAIIEIPEQTAMGEMSVGFVFSAPIESRNIEVFASEPLRDIAFSMKFDDGESGHLFASIPFAAVAKGPIGGEVSIKDSVTGRRSSIWIVINKAQPIKLSPLSLTFRKNEKTGDHHATALLKMIVHPESKEEKVADADNKVSSDRNDEEPSVTCFYQGRILRLEKKKLGNHTYRLDIRAAKAELDVDSSDRNELNFKIQYGGRDFDVPRGVSVR